MSHNSGSLVSGIGLSVNPQILAAVAVGVILLLLLWKFKSGDSKSYSHSDDGGLLGKIFKYALPLAILAILAGKILGFI